MVLMFLIEFDVGDFKGSHNGFECFDNVNNVDSFSNDITSHFILFPNKRKNNSNFCYFETNLDSGYSR